ncbi:hypothetical protein Tco_0343531 [Tanacetum coccineum]
MVGGRSATHSPLRRSAMAGKAATAAVVAAMVQGEGGKGGYEGGAVREEKSSSLASELLVLGFHPLWLSSDLVKISSQCRYQISWYFITNMVI